MTTAYTLNNDSIADSHISFRWNIVMVNFVN